MQITVSAYDQRNPTMDGKLFLSAMQINIFDS